MVIFDLDGTLADCEHRRHFVDPIKNPDVIQMADGKWVYKANYPQALYFWKSDWKSFYEACDKDEPIEPVIQMWNDQISQGMMAVHQIWSGRCESVRNKTEKWLDKHLLCFNSENLKMRPIGDYTPDHILKEKWLDEYITSMWPKLEPGSDETKYKIYSRKNPIEFVFDDRKKVVEMWRRRGIFVFDVSQGKGDF